MRTISLVIAAAESAARSAKGTLAALIELLTPGSTSVWLVSETSTCHRPLAAPVRSRGVLHLSLTCLTRAVPTIPIARRLCTVLSSEEPGIAAGS